MCGFKDDVHARDVVCQHCGSRGSRNNILTVHHVIPKCQGGPNSSENCILLCQLCHRELHESQGYPHGSRKHKKKRR